MVRAVGLLITILILVPLVALLPGATAEDAGEEFDTGLISEGESSLPITFATEGTYNYLCGPHPYMTGIITVTDDQPVVNITVFIEDFLFLEEEVEVGTGSQITWANNDSVAHSAQGVLVGSDAEEEDRQKQVIGMIIALALFLAVVIYLVVVFSMDPDKDSTADE